MKRFQLWAGSPVYADGPRQTVQRLAGLGYEWHNVMHMIMGPVTSSVYQTLTAKRPFDREEFVRQLNELPGDWPSPEESAAADVNPRMARRRVLRQRASPGGRMDAG